MRKILPILLFLLPLASLAQKYDFNNGEYTNFFRDRTTHRIYTITNDLGVGAAGGAGTPGIPTEIVTNQTHKQMKSTIAGLHEGGGVSLDSGFVFMGGSSSFCQLGNGLTTGPSTTYEILTDANGVIFDSITQVSGGWAPVNSYPFYAAIKQYNPSSTQNNAVWIWGDGGTLGLGSCLKPTPTFVGGFGSSEVVVSVTAINSSIHAVCSDGTVWVLGGTDDYAANTGVNATPTTWTQITIPGGVPIAYVVKGNAFTYYVSTDGNSLFGNGEFGWLIKNQATASFSPVNTPVLLNSFYPSSIFPISNMVAAHTSYMILSTANKLFTGGSNETGQCGTGPTIIWPLYTTGGTTNYNGTPAPWNWNVGMGEYVQQCTQVLANSGITFTQISGGILYSFFFTVQGIQNGVYVILSAGRNKAAGISYGIVFADVTGTRIGAAYHMGLNEVYWAYELDPLTIFVEIIASCPGCADGALTGTPCSFGTDAPSRPNTNLVPHLVVTPFGGGFSWSAATTTTDAGHKILWPHSFITQTAGTAQDMGARAGKAGYVTGLSAGSYTIVDTIVDNSFDTVQVSASFTVPALTQTTWFVDSLLGSDANAGDSLHPLQTVGGVDALTLVAGDTVKFKRGYHYPGTLRVTASGTPASPIVIMAYGSGAAPYYGSLLTVAMSGGGANQTGTCSGCTPKTRLVVFNDTLGTVARTPNAPFVLNYTPGSSTTTQLAVNSADLTALGTIVGDTVGIWPFSYATFKGTITAQATSTITFSPAMPTGFTGGIGYWVVGTPPDVSAEYLYSGGAGGTLTVNGSAGQRVRAAGVDTAVAFYGAYIRMIDGNVSGANTALVYLGGVADSLFHDTLTYSGQDGIVINAKRVHINRVSTNYCQNIGVNNLSTADTGMSLLNSVILNSGMTPGMNQNGNSQSIGVVSPVYGTVIRGNIIGITGFNGIYTGGADSIFVRFNFGYSYNQHGIDGGWAYLWRNSGLSKPVGDHIDSNLIINGGGPYSFFGKGITKSSAVYGIYFDSHENGDTATHNTIWHNISGGWQNHGPSNVFTNNTVGESGYAAVNNEEKAGVATITGTVVSNNTIYGDSTGDFLIRLTTPAADLLTMMTANNNTFIHFSLTSTFFTLSSTDAGTSRTIASWRTATGQDAASTFINQTLQLATNQTFSLATISFPYVGFYNGKYYRNKISLPALTGQPLQLINPGTWWRFKKHP